MAKRIDYRFRALVSADSLEALLVDYFRSKDADLNEKDMVMWANCACWIPLAQKKRQEQGICSEAEFKHSGRLSIYKLLQHIYLLAHTCGLEDELELVPTLRSPHSNSTHHINYPISRQDKSIGLQPNPGDISDQNEGVDEPIMPPTADLLHHEDDATFQAIFDQ